MKFKHKRWRDAVVLHLSNKGPQLLSQILDELRNKEGRPFVSAPRLNAASNLLHADPRISVREVKKLGSGISGRYRAYEYAVFGDGETQV
jgi:hypothetical protein